MVALRNCFWSSDEAKDGPDTCASGYLALTETKINRMFNSTYKMMCVGPGRYSGERVLVND
jgi:hypothetical protein